MTVKLVTLSCITLTMAAAAIGHAVRGSYIWAIAAIAIGLVWGLLEVLDKGEESWAAAFFAASFAVVAVGAAKGTAPLLAVFAGSMVLASWDLCRFRARLRKARSAERTAQWKHRHLVQLGVACAIGLVVASAAVVVRIQLRFAVVFIAGIAALYAFFRLLRAVVSPEEHSQS